jgi:cyclopropane fatty-acyl-phospholipid synthase-like methyltransferase
MRTSKLFLLTFTAILLLTGVAAAQERRTAEEYIKLLEGERRVSGLQVARVVDALNLKPGQRICDLGSGSGLFTRPMAQAVGPQGVVYAIDIDPDLLKHVAQTATEQKLANIKTILGGEADPKLPEPVDLIAIIDTLHHIPNQAAYLKNLRRYLRPNGRIAIIDFSKTWPAGHEKMIYKQEDLDGWMKAAGFTLITQHYFLDNDFFVIYQ